MSRTTADVVVIGGGIAGLSAGAALAKHGRVVVLEAESALGYHSSGRSATFLHYGIGGHVVRSLTEASRPFFAAPPEGFAEVPISEARPALFIADEEMLPRLRALRDVMAPHSPGIEDADDATMRALCPVLRVGETVVAGVVDHGGRKLDADLLLQGYARAVRKAGEVRLGARVETIAREGGDWTVTTEAGDTIAAPIVVNAAGAWADTVAALAGVAPLGLTPMRRTIIAVDAPEGSAGWPFVKTAVDSFYMLPAGGQLLASPVDEHPSEPMDAWPEDEDMAVAAFRLEHWTTIAVTRIAHRWAGLRTFAPDRVPVAGFAERPGFFWLAGQGGYGLQTAPAMAAATEALVTGGAWPLHGVTAGELGPGRFAAQAG